VSGFSGQCHWPLSYHPTVVVAASVLKMAKEEDEK